MGLFSEVKPIVLYSPNQYNKKVLITNWHLPREAEPRDFDPLKDQHRSTYKSLGWWSGEWPTTSVTHDMMEQVWMRTGGIPSRVKPVDNFCLVPKSESGEVIDMEIDYRTTTEVDYRPLIPIKPKPVVIEKPPPRELNLICISELCDASTPKRRGINTFLDDNLSGYYMNRNVKRFRYESFDPLRGKYMTMEDYCPRNTGPPVAKKN